MRRTKFMWPANKISFAISPHTVRVGIISPVFFNIERSHYKHLHAKFWSATNRLPLHILLLYVLREPEAVTLRRSVALMAHRTLQMFRAAYATLSPVQHYLLLLNCSEYRVPIIAAIFGEDFLAGAI